MQTIEEYPDPIRELRRKVEKAKEELILLSRNIEIPSDVFSRDQIQIQNKYNQILNKTKELYDLLDDYDDLWFGLQQKIRSYLESPVKF